MKLALWLVGWTALVLLVGLMLACGLSISLEPERCRRVAKVIGQLGVWVWLGGGVALFLYLDSKRRRKPPSPKPPPDW
jgi:hypothetical protein